MQPTLPYHPEQLLAPQPHQIAPSQEVINHQFDEITENYSGNRPAATAGVYGSHVSRGEEYSRENLPTAAERREAAAPYIGNATTGTALGMASLPEQYKDQQKGSSSYKGHTSEELMAAHRNWSWADALATETRRQQVESAAQEAAKVKYLTQAQADLHTSFTQKSKKERDDDRDDTPVTLPRL